MDINLFVNITSRAWSLPILSCMHEGIPGRQASLLTATGASRTAFTQSLQHLIEIGLLERNPGHGHPLRPEFRLTQIGVAAAEMAHKIQNASKAEDLTLLRRAWTVPILTCLHTVSHFNDIRRCLPRITDRALSQSLQKMEQRAWVTREIEAGTRPPRSIYQPINLGNEICHITGPEISFAAIN